MNNEYDWEMTSKDALDKLGELQKESRGDVYRYLLEAATVIADVLCEREQRFSILELISVSGRGVYDGYKILFANPLESEDSPRHGASEIGMLHEPCDKVALLEAIEYGKTVVVNDVAKSPLTRYIGEHIERKKLKHMAVLPFQGYLLLFDRVVCADPFNQKDEIFLDRASKIITYGFRWYAKKKDSINMVLLKNVLSHRIRNPMMIIGGFYKRLEEALDQDNPERAFSYAKIISQAGERLTKDLEFLIEMRLFLSGSKNQSRTARKLSSYLAAFSSQDFRLDEALFQKSFLLNYPEEVVEQLFSRIKSFMLGNREDHDLSVRLVSSNDADVIILDFHCTGFKKIKSAIDENLFFINWIVETLGGKTELGDDYLIVTLPGLREKEGD